MGIYEKRKKRRIKKDAPKIFVEPDTDLSTGDQGDSEDMESGFEDNISNLVDDDEADDEKKDKDGKDEKNDDDEEDDDSDKDDEESDEKEKDTEDEDKKDKE